MINFAKDKLRALYYFKSLRRFKEKGSNLIFSKGGTFLRPEEISLGSNIFIASNFHISARNLVIGDNVMIGPNLVIECDNHVYDNIGTTMFETRDERKVSGVTIESDVWIGAGVIILPGVTIGTGSIVGAGSIVTKTLPSYSICVGNPCKAIKQRFSEEDLKKHLDILNKN